MRIAVLIPAHNAGEAIGGIIKQIRDRGFPAVVVDDGSDDDTYEAAKNAGVVVLKHSKNLGKGAALRTGFEYFLNGNFDAVITMDADGQHDPASLNDFVKFAEEKCSNIIVGNRMHDTASMPWLRIQTNRFMSRFLSKRIGQFVPDTQCGYRLIKKGLLRKMQLCANRYEIESEMLIQAARHGAKIDSINISSIYAGHKSRINPFVDTLRFIRLMMTL